MVCSQHPEARLDHRLGATNHNDGRSQHTLVIPDQPIRQRDVLRHGVCVRWYRGTSDRALIAPWGFRWNWERVLISPQSATRPIRFRLSNLLFVMALGAALYAYHRYLTPLFGK